MLLLRLTLLFSDLLESYFVRLQEKIAKRKIEAAEQSVMSDAESEAMRREQGKASQEVKEEWENRQREIAILEAKKVEF